MYNVICGAGRGQTADLLLINPCCSIVSLISVHFLRLKILNDKV
jgi:hypothetical protein